MSESTEMPSELESLLRADGDGPARRIDAAAAQALIDGAIAGADVAQVRPLRGKRVFFLLAAAIVFGGSAAAMYAAYRARPEVTSAPPAAPARRAPAAMPKAAPEPVVAAAPEAPTAAEPQARPAEVPSAGAARQQDVRVQDLLRRANRMRGDGDYRGAEHTYLRVVAQSPGGAPAYTARVAAASLRLERLSDPRGAIELYAAALRDDPQGALSPEIHTGMAVAYRKLGNAGGERRALQALLAQKPEGPAADRARARLRDLSR